jgi:hypothetical protein
MASEDHKAIYINKSPIHYKKEIKIFKMKSNVNQKEMKHQEKNIL